MRYAFFGNRFYVLEAMLTAGLQVAEIGAVSGSYLARALTEKQIAFTACANKQEFLAWLSGVKAERLITNGCPYKVPADMLSRMQCINVHPSYLPDLRGADPIPGAILFGRDSGATVHAMDAGIDTGEVIAQIKLAYDPQWNALTLYPLCFQAEVDVFKLALARDFVPVSKQVSRGDEIYYSFKDNDLQIDFAQSAQDIRRRVLAFNTPNKLARFSLEGKNIKVKNAKILPLNSSHKENEVLFITTGDMGVAKGDVALVLEFAEAVQLQLQKGDFLHSLI